MPRPPTKPKDKWGYIPVSKSERNIIQDDIEDTYNLPEELGLNFNAEQLKQYRNIIDVFVAECTQFQDRPKIKHIRAALQRIDRTSNDLINSHDKIEDFKEAIANLDLSTNRQLMLTDRRLDSPLRKKIKKNPLVGTEIMVEFINYI